MSHHVPYNLNLKYGLKYGLALEAKMKDLSAINCKNLKDPGFHRVSKGLYLKVTKAGTKSWVFRYRERKTGKLKDMGLGAYPAVTLSVARDRVVDQHRLLAGGFDPFEEKRKQEAVLSEDATPSFKECAEQYVDIQRPTWRNAKHAAQWTSTLKTYAYPTIGGLTVDKVTRDHVMAILKPIWLTKTETATRLRQRLEAVLAFADVKGWREGNPAVWRHGLDKLLPAPEKIINRKHHKSMPYKELPDFFKRLSKVEGVPAACLKFSILTASRSGEAFGAKWSEFDLKEGVWTIPGERMKAGKQHRVPLSGPVLELLEELRGKDEVFLFPGRSAGKHISNMAMTKVLKSMGVDVTVHGFRSSFRTWAAERTSFPREICETALAHSNRDDVEAAYLDSDHLIKRGKLMEQWASFCQTPATDNVIPISANG